MHVELNNQRGIANTGVTRRALLAAGALLPARPVLAAGLPELRLGILPFGTVQWIADVVRRNRLDTANGFTLRTTKLASTEAGKVALLGHAVDVAVSDWPFVASQRSQGGTLTFSPFSSSVGGIMVPTASPVHQLTDLKDLRLGVAGGAADKSWLIVRAAARKQGLDIEKAARLSFGAPPLLSAALGDGGLDALLTFWNFCARLQATGLREAVSLTDCARALGLQDAPVLVGYVFDAGWAAANRPAIDGFLRAAAAAEDLLVTRPAEWAAIRPLMDAPDEALFLQLKSRFLAGISRPDPATLTAQANQLLVLLAQQGIAAAATLPGGVFWRGA